MDDGFQFLLLWKIRVVQNSLNLESVASRMGNGSEKNLMQISDIAKVGRIRDVPKSNLLS